MTILGTRAAWLALYPAWTGFALLLPAHMWLLNRRRGIEVP